MSRDVAFARAGEAHVAYRVIGEGGRVDVVVVAGALFPFELLVEDRVASRFIAGLAALGRVLVFDKRGVGLSDPMTDWSRSAQEQWAEDLVTVIEAAGLERPVVVSWEPHGVARLAASARPDLFAAMVLVNPAWATRSLLELMRANAGRPLPNRTIEELAFPSRINDDEFVAWLARAGRSGASPASAARIWEHVLNYQPALTPPGIATRTLVLHNRDSRQPEAEVLAVAEEIAGATFVQVAGADVYPVAGDVDLLITEIAEFVTGGPSGLTPLRYLAAVLFTDLVDSTVRAVDEGDAHWRALLDVHDRTVQQAVRDHGGRVVKYTGDGVLALMPSATGALDTAESIRHRLAEQGLRIRAGIHVGDVDVRGDDVSGFAVNVAARIMNHADADETLVSDAARQATLGSPHRFEATRTTQLKGLPEQWTLHRHIP
ncbi:MAG TPA: adenylate/guanylate cyclase domain-containing protein [Mycobacterium sp.]|nr:adenylate/guanylate cyclase domain-containing protein [Mycobacterium sp.]